MAIINVLARLPTPRSAFACCAVRNSKGEREIIAAGGSDEKGNALTTVEIFSLTNWNWRTGRKSKILAQESNKLI